MTLAEMLLEEAEETYKVTDNLMALVNDGDLDWKPESGKNWMTLGQLLEHLASSCGSMIKGFRTGDWGLPEGMSFEDIPPEEMLPPAEALPSVATVAEAREKLQKDRDVTHEHLAGVTDDTLLSTRLAPPWGGPEKTLFQQLLMSVYHMQQHKGQLFYYHKLMGQSVDTGTLWAG